MIHINNQPLQNLVKTIRDKIETITSTLHFETLTPDTGRLLSDLMEEWTQNVLNGSRGSWTRFYLTSLRFNIARYSGRSINFLLDVTDSQVKTVLETVHIDDLIVDEEILKDKDFKFLKIRTYVGEIVNIREEDFVWIQYLWDYNASLEKEFLAKNPLMLHTDKVGLYINDTLGVIREPIECEGIMTLPYMSGSFGYMYIILKSDRMAEFTSAYWELNRSREKCYIEYRRK